MVWKMIFLFQGCILRFHVNFCGVFGPPIGTADGCWGRWLAASLPLRIVTERKRWQKRWLLVALFHYRVVKGGGVPRGGGSLIFPNFRCEKGPCQKAKYELSREKLFFPTWKGSMAIATPISLVLVYHGPLEITTFWEWLAIYFHNSVDKL